MLQAGAAPISNMPGCAPLWGRRFCPSTEPLASLGGALNGIRLDGRHVSNLFFSGPGAGPAVTAATLLDDAIQAASFERRLHRTAAIFASTGLSIVARDVLVPARDVPRRAAGRQRRWPAWYRPAGLPVERVADHATANSRWLLIGPQGRRASTPRSSSSQPPIASTRRRSEGSDHAFSRSRAECSLPGALIARRIEHAADLMDDRAGAIDAQSRPEAHCDRCLIGV